MENDSEIKSIKNEKENKNIVKRKSHMWTIVSVIAGFLILSILIANITKLSARQDLYSLSDSTCMENIRITDFVAGLNVDENWNIPVVFEVSADKTDEFAYMLQAVSNDQNRGIVQEFHLARGYGMLNQALNLNIYIGHILDIDNTMFKLTASTECGNEASKYITWLFVQ